MRNGYRSLIWKSLKKYETHVTFVPWRNAKGSHNLKYSHYAKLKNIFLGSVPLKIVLKTIILPGNIDLKAVRIRIGKFNLPPPHLTFLLDTGYSNDWNFSL